MPRISVDFYDLKEGDPIDNPLVAAIASGSLSAGYKDPCIFYINCIYGNDEDKESLIKSVVCRASSSRSIRDVYVATTVNISPFDFPPNKYTIEKQDENDTREIIPVDEVMTKSIKYMESLGFESIFDYEPGNASFMVYTGTEYFYNPEHAKEVLDFIRKLPEENPEPTHMRVTQEELAKMMGGEPNDEQTEESSEEE